MNLDEIKKVVFKKKNIDRGEGFLSKLIKSNTGISSKNFFLVAVTIIGCLLLLVPGFTLIVEVIFTHTIATDLSGMAAYIGAVASLFATAGITKAWSEKFEHHQGNHRKTKIDETVEDEIDEEIDD